MGLETVLDEIRAKAKQEEQDILTAANNEADAIMQEAKADAAKATAKRNSEAEARLQALEREILGASEFAARRRLLSVQRELTADFRQRVVEALSKLTDARTEALLKALVGRAKKEIPKGRAHARKEDLPTLETLGYDRGEARQGAGGFIVEGPGGEVLLDHRYEVLLDDVWKQILVDNQDLFEVG